MLAQAQCQWVCTVLDTWGFIIVSQASDATQLQKQYNVSLSLSLPPDKYSYICLYFFVSTVMSGLQISLYHVEEKYLSQSSLKRQVSAFWWTWETPALEGNLWVVILGDVVLLKHT